MGVPVINISCIECISNDDYISAISNVVDSGTYILGPQVAKFEQDMADYLEADYAIGVANGTDALVLALDALGIGAGDEVITTPYTFFATAETICRVGATPVFVDVLEETYNIDPALLEAAITDKTKAIMPVHIFGNPVDFDAVLEIAGKHSLYVVEDACQAIGASYKERRVGAIGDIACFSFFPTKNLGAFGDGGMVTTNSSELAERIRMLRFHGQKVKYQNEIMGYNSRLDEIQAAILNVKLPHLDAWNVERRAIAARYDLAFEGIEGLRIPKETEGAYSVYHIYSIMADDRDRLADFLKGKGVGTGIYYAIPLHLQRALSFLGYREGDFPVAEKLSKRALALPMYPELSELDQATVIEAVRTFYNR